MPRSTISGELTLFVSPNTITLVAERRARILGFVYVTIDARNSSIVLFTVVPEWRRRGIGTALYTGVRETLPRDVTTIGSTYALMDTASITFFEKLGFIRGKQYIWLDRTI